MRDEFCHTEEGEEDGGHNHKVLPHTKCRPPPTEMRDEFCHTKEGEEDGGHKHKVLLQKKNYIKLYT
jgi:hypothetical protein